MKGDDTLRQVAEILRAKPYRTSIPGFVEGKRHPAGTTDVVVTDGSPANVA